MCASWYEGTAQLLSLIDIYFNFVLLAETINQWKNSGRQETGVPREYPWWRASENETEQEGEMI